MTPFPYSLAPKPAWGLPFPQSVKSVRIRENSLLQHTFLCKTNPIFRPFSPRLMPLSLVLLTTCIEIYNFVIFQKRTQTNPIRSRFLAFQTQFKPKTNPIFISAKSRCPSSGRRRVILEVGDQPDKSGRRLRARRICWACSKENRCY
jgi:hypothetical protein